MTMMIMTMNDNDNDVDQGMVAVYYIRGMPFFRN